MGLKVSSNRFKSTGKSLGLPWRFEATHSSLWHLGRSMRVLRPVIQGSGMDCYAVMISWYSRVNREAT